MNLSVMTFHESYGDIPRALLSLIQWRNVSPADYAQIVNALGAPTWAEVYDFIEASSPDGFFRMPRYL